MAAKCGCSPALDVGEGKYEAHKIFRMEGKLRRKGRKESRAVYIMTRGVKFVTTDKTVENTGFPLAQ